jgi:hypothetical protein
MAIRLPSQRAYYLASWSAGEPLLCWLPKADLAKLVSAGKARRELLDLYPEGLEI